MRLPVHSYRHRSRPAASERLVNCFAEASPREGKGPTMVVRMPGSRPAVTLSGSGRGLFNWNERLYAVSGNSLYRIDSDHTATELGTIAGTQLCTFATNLTQLAICAAPDVYVYDGALSQVGDTDFIATGAKRIASVDGYIVFTHPNSARFGCSDLNDAMSYDALNYATAEGDADPIVGIDVDHRQVVLAGSRSMELWYNAGGSGFPFVRDSNGFIQLGCAAGGSLCKADNSLFWLASDRTVRRLNGLTPVRVSQHGVEQAIAAYYVDDAEAFSYTQDGHAFYVLNFPIAGATWVLDITTGEWSERVSHGSTRWRPCAAVSCYGRVYVQRHDTGDVGYLDPDYYQDFGDILRAEWTYGGIYKGGASIRHDMLECVVETGVGTALEDDPEVMLDVSDDGGRTWRAMPNRKLGREGEFRKRVRWNRLGTSRDRIYRMAVSDPVKVTVMDTVLEVS